MRWLRSTLEGFGSGGQAGPTAERDPAPDSNDRAIFSTAQGIIPGDRIFDAEVERSFSGASHVQPVVIAIGLQRILLDWIDDDAAAAAGKRLLILGRPDSIELAEITGWGPNGRSFGIGWGASERIRFTMRDEEAARRADDALTQAITEAGMTHVDHPGGTDGGGPAVIASSAEGPVSADRAPRFPVELADGSQAQAVAVSNEAELDRAIASLGIPRGPVVLLFGGAGELADDDRDRIERFFTSALIPAVAAIGGTIVDGGTDAGVMRLIGEARARVGEGVRLVGVAPIGKVRVPGSDGSTALAPGHSEIVLVPGSEWGAESGWFHPIADRLAAGPTVTVLVNGGPVAIHEAELSVARATRIVIVEGTGRAADEIAAVRRTPDAASPVAAIAASPWIVVVDVTIGSTALAARLAGTEGGEP